VPGVENGGVESSLMVYQVFLPIQLYFNLSNPLHCQKKAVQILYILWLAVLSLWNISQKRKMLCLQNGIVGQAWSGSHGILLSRR